MKSSSRNGARVIWIVIHTAEGARDVDDLQAFFERSTNSSSHAGADDEKLEEGWVPYELAAWTLRSGNRFSDNLELCGFADWTRAEWLQHMGMLTHAGRWIRSRCLARGIPIVKIGPSDVDFDRPGVIGHHDYTLGTGDGTHWDPGPGFPWDVVMAIARGEQDMQADERSWLADLHMTVVSGVRRDKQLNRDLGTVNATANTASIRADVAAAAAKEAKAAVEQLNTTIGLAIAEAVGNYFQQNPPVVQVDYAAVAKAVADENHRRTAE
jgi:hypothetical protein